MKFYEAVRAMRSGMSAVRNGHVVRFLTQEETVAMGHPPMISPHHVGLHDVSQIPPIEFRPTEEDVAATDWETAEDGTASADALAEEHAALTDFIDANDAADLAQPTTDAPEER